MRIFLLFYLFLFLEIKIYELTNGMEHPRNWQIEEGSSSKGKQKLKGSPLYVLDNGLWSVNRSEEMPARNEEMPALPNEYVNLIGLKKLGEGCRLWHETNRRTEDFRLVSLDILSFFKSQQPQLWGETIFAPFCKNF
uniref:Uncharacterized protein n=1 Tax=Meloidogyne enterolobii TaxID=390850 RepID=A0A6V7WLU3_MELEN|nr:unnamed protein product [Meloidogyne enterolobii]